MAIPDPKTFKVAADWPLYFEDSLIPGSLESGIGIATRWSVADVVVRDVPREHFAVAGQLYSKEGINYIIRNVLLNPTVRHLIVTGKERSGSGETLIDFWKNGTTDIWLQKEIDAEAQKLFREQIVSIDEVDEKELPAKVAELQSKQEKANRADPIFLPEPKIETPDTFPSEETIFRVQGKTVGEVWLKLLKVIMRFGQEKEHYRGDPLKEIVNLCSIITDEDPDNLKVEPYFDFNEAELQQYLPQILEASEASDTAGQGDYTYGQRLRNFQGKYNQLDLMVKALKKDINSLKSYAFTWEIEDHEGGSRPCLTQLQALVQNKKLFLTVYFRSHDMFSAYPRNLLALRKVQKELADPLKLNLGPLVCISGSAHLYKKNWEQIKNILEENDQLFCQMDPRGNMLITIDGDHIKIIHKTVEGKELAQYTGKSAKVILNKMFQDLAISDIRHAMDVGEQLAHAELALKYGLPFEQDHPLDLPLERHKQNK